MKLAGLTAALLILAGCCHAPHAPHAKVSVPPPDRWTLPAQAKPTDRFCVQSEGLTPDLPFEDALGPACVPVAVLRAWIRSQRYAN